MWKWVSTLPAQLSSLCLFAKLRQSRATCILLGTSTALFLTSLLVKVKILECTNVLYFEYYTLPLCTLCNVCPDLIPWLITAGVSCGQLVNQSNGRVDTSAGTSFGVVARYSCDTGYTLIGPAERTCQADGRWNGSVPRCESKLWALHQILCLWVCNCSFSALTIIF